MDFWAFVPASFVLHYLVQTSAGNVRRREWKGKIMNKTLIFPLIIIFLNFGAAGMYLFSGEYRKAIYFFAAAVLNITVM